MELKLDFEEELELVDSKLELVDPKEEFVAIEEELTTEDEIGIMLAFEEPEDLSVPLAPHPARRETASN